MARPRGLNRKLGRPAQLDCGGPLTGRLPIPEQRTPTLAGQDANDRLRVLCTTIGAVVQPGLLAAASFSRLYLSVDHRSRDAPSRSHCMAESAVTASPTRPESRRNSCAVCKTLRRRRWAITRSRFVKHLDCVLRVGGQERHHDRPPVRSLEHARARSRSLSRAVYLWCPSLDQTFPAGKKKTTSVMGAWPTTSPS